MIEKCNNKDLKRIEEYIDVHYPTCLYLYLDVKKYGPDSDLTKSFFIYENNKLKGVILLYHTAMHLFSKNNDFNKDEVRDFVIYHNPSMICAAKETILTLQDEFTSLGFYAEYGHVGQFISLDKKSQMTPQLAKTKDIEGIANLLYQDDDIGASYHLNDLKQQIKERLEQGFVRSYVIKEGNKVICHVGTGAETDKVCTIAYCVTDPSYRGRGLFSSLLAYACEKLSQEGKEIYSIYYPENSRLLHHKVGFKDYCECGKLFKKID